MNTFRSRAAAWLLLAALGMATSAAAQSGGGYDLSWHTVNGGGVTFATGGGFSLGGTAGQPDAGNHAGAGFTLSGGFWFGGATTFMVAKDFSDDSAASVSVSLTCTSGVVSPASALASEAAPAMFTVSGFTGAPNCTATEVAPAGYTVNETGCAAVALSTGLCTIANTLNAGSFSVAKDFSDNSPASVSVSLACTSGIVNPATALASEAVPAIFNVTGFTGTPACTAAEIVPAGYTANQSGCAGVALTTGICTIVNTQNAGNFVVAKDFSDNNPASVSVSLACTSGTVTPSSALASESVPAGFTVTGFSGTPTCTATEIVTAGYVADRSACTGVALSTGSCTIVNTANPGTISISLTTVSSPATQGTAFSFVAGGGLMPTSFTLTDGDVQTFSNVAAGSGYSVDMIVPPGWTLTSATCSDGSDPASIDLAIDESISCSFVISETGAAVAIPALDRLGMLLLMCGLAAGVFAQCRLQGGSPQRF
jgi:hypothetical protein